MTDIVERIRAAIARAWYGGQQMTAPQLARRVARGERWRMSDDQRRINYEAATRN